MNMLDGEDLCNSHTILVQLVSECLGNDPQTRPSSVEALGRLKMVKKERERIYGDNYGKILDVTAILVVKEMESKDKIIKDLQVRCCHITKLVLITMVTVLMPED